MSRPAGPRDGGRWYDADAGPPVRPYAVTGGRTTPGPGGIRLDLVALVAVEARAAAGTLPGPEHEALLRLCRAGTQSVAEPAAGADLPVGVVRALLGDLLEAGHVASAGRCRRPGCRRRGSCGNSSRD
ncbi:hypothetical protein GCM10009731_60470 [Streptomyces globosus]